MGNKYQKEEPIQVQNPEILLQLKQTKLEIGDAIEGTVYFKISNNKKPPFSIYIKVVGIEEAYYNFKEDNKSKYEYNIKKNKFLKCRKYLWQNINQFLENRDYEIRFKIEPNVTNPSVDYNCKNEIRCSIQYQVKAVLKWKNNKKLYSKDKCYQSVVFYKQCPKDLREAVPDEKIETITTFKCFRSSKGLLFTALKVDKKAYFENQQVCVEVSIDNTFGNLNIVSAHVFFYLEFLMKERLFQGMPKYVIGEEKLDPMRQEEQVKICNFTILPQENLPFQSYGAKVGCRYIVVLQIKFEKYCTGVDDVEIIIPVEYFPDINKILEPQQDDSKMFSDALKQESENQQELYEKTEYIDINYFYNEKTRIAELTQIVK